MNSIADQIRDQVLALTDADPATLNADSPLVTTRIVDSLAMIELVEFLQTRFGIKVSAHEAQADNFETIARIVALVQGKGGR